MLRVLLVLVVMVFPGVGAEAGVACPPNAGDVKSCGLRQQDVEYLRTYFKCRQSGRSDEKCKSNADELGPVLPYMRGFSDGLKSQLAVGGLLPHRSTVDGEMKKLFDGNRKAMAEHVGSDLHDKWRGTRKVDPVTAQARLEAVEQRMRDSIEDYQYARNYAGRTSVDHANAWMANIEKSINGEYQLANDWRAPLHRGEVQVYDPRRKFGMDIANANFTNLNETAKKANFRAGEHVVGLIERGLTRGTPLNDDQMLREIHNFFIRENMSAARELKTPEDFDRLYSRIQSGTDVEGWNYKMENGKRVEIPEAQRYPPKTQLKNFSELGQLDQDLDRFVLNSSRDAVHTRLPSADKSESRAASNMAKHVRERFKANPEFKAQEELETKRLRAKFGPGFALSGAAIAATVGAEMVMKRLSDKRMCADAYPFTAVSTAFTNHVPGVREALCRPNFEVNDIAKENSQVSKFLQMKDGEVYQVLNGNPGKMNGPCDYYLKLYMQVSSCEQPKGPVQSIVRGRQ